MGDWPHKPEDFTGAPDIRAPFGCVFLPSPFLDTMSPRWIDWIRNHRNHCAAVNAAGFSERLLRNNAAPLHWCWLDPATNYAEGAENHEEQSKAQSIFQFYRGTIWAQHGEIQHKKIWPVVLMASRGAELPEWMHGHIEVKGDDQDRDGVKLAGQYTACAAANLLAWLLGWKCTIFIVGNMGVGGYCRMAFEPKRDWTREMNERKEVHRADAQQWWWLRKCAKERTGTEIVMVDGPRISTMPWISEREAMEVLHGPNGRSEVASLSTVGHSE